MLKNYLLIAIRNLQRNTVYSFINITGLAVGIASSILILLWVYDEITYDAFQPKLPELHQVWVNAEYDGKINTWNSVPLPTYRALKTEDARIKRTTITDWGGDHLLTVGDKRLVKRGYFVEEEFLSMFQFEIVKGDPEKALNDPYAIALTEATAQALFGTEDPINQVIKLDNNKELRVTALLKNVPANSSFNFDMLLSHKLFAQEDWVKRSETEWGNYSFQVYVELQPGVKKEDVDATIKDLLTRNGQTDMKRELFLHPMTDWHLYSNFENGKSAGGMIDYVKLFSGIAILVLVIACINFMNLATARSERRAREVGIRKSVGSRRQELIIQFLGESLLIACIGFVFSIMLVELALPFYNSLTQKQLSLQYNSAFFWIFSISLMLFTGLLSGSYPALYLSSFQPVKVLKGKVQVGRNASLPRKALVTIQFMFSIVLIIGTLVIYKQIQFVKNRQLGYNQQNLLSIDYTPEIGKHYETIKQELLQSGVVVSVTKSNSPITDIYSNNFLDWPGKPETQKVIFSTIASGYDYTKTMGIRMLEGRDFSQEFRSDTSAIIVNKAALDVMGLKNPIGEQLTLWGSKYTLIGIMDNVLMGSPYRDVAPMFLILQPEWANALTIRVQETTDLPATISTIESIFTKYNSAYPFQYKFVDAEFERKFTTINLIGNLANLFAFLAILITCMGLFGLAAFTAEQRTKEIGIRKVLGASVTSLVMLLARDFSRLVLIAFVLAAPFAWWVLDDFLQRYPHRISIPWWSMPAAGLLALTFAVLIVSTQALRAATSNPSQSLRNE